jgi:crotonobetainyl-CoA:carnitine CoA-transferase CaiB-like acyl-CoA transferase
MSAPETKRGGPLQGVRVIELGKVWAGPETGKQLAFLGAEVIKIESMGSIDVTRIIGAKSINAAGGFRSVNPQKLSVSINVKDPKGIELLLELLKTADMVLENLRPGAIERMGLGYDVVKAVNPNIVYVSMGMYGNDGPLAYQTGYAPCFNAIGGMSAMVGYEGRTPTGINVRYGDSTYGTVAAFAGLVALVHARRTGVGQYVDVAAVEAMNGTIADVVMDYTLNGHTQACDGNKHAEMAPHNVYRCGETDWIAIAVSSDAKWQALADAMGQPALGGDARFATLAARKANEEELDRLVSAWTESKDASELAADLQGRGVAASKSQNSIDLIADGMLWERGLFVDLEECDGDIRPNVGAAFKLSRGATISHGSPALGQHNDYVLGEILGLSPDEQKRLAEAGITH